MSRKKVDTTNDNIDDPEEAIKQKFSEEEIEGYEKAEVRRKSIKRAGTVDIDTWTAFIEEFTKDFEIIDRNTKQRTRNSIATYKEQLIHMVDKKYDDNNKFNILAQKQDVATAIFLVDFVDLQSWAEKNKDYEDESHNFGRLIESLAIDPEGTLSALRIAVYDRLSIIDEDFARGYEERLVCTIHNYPHLKEPPELNSDTIGRMYRIEGLIISYDEAPHQRIIETFWQCINCTVTMNRKESDKPPKSCYHCNKHDFVELRTHEKIH